MAFYDHCAASDGAELERFGRTTARREAPILRWHRARLTNAATAGTNLIITNIKRLGIGFRNYRRRLLLLCGAGILVPLHQYDSANHRQRKSHATAPRIRLTTSKHLGQ